MIRINKSTEENALIRFALSDPNATWDDFRGIDQGNPYNSTKKLLFKEQSELCAYCEVSLQDCSENTKRIEHFKSKSGNSNLGENLHLDWFNLLGVCIGGSDFKNKETYDLPKNLSCDSHKARIEEVEKIADKNWLGKVLFPLDLQENNKLFNFDKSTGMLIPNTEYCANNEIPHNKFESTFQLVEETIRIFNLNCDRLNKARLVIFYDFERQIKIARGKSDINRIKFLASNWYGRPPKSFQTTRNFLLRDNLITSKIINLD
ncbi:retron Ec78 anti-phage system effector HNH endonuclease PtuB [Psychromonas arctica]|uniref:retron Ec78 anti-phage system effector HNH endonuclease PtuB n=1 Tax=Psychromonas arctica TaxID=168275 RepID=UPI0003FA8FCB|nr:retron Ec78 anti-phage system effector HNH endonuclease PtuB [Psychromonas arctica]